MHNSLPSGALRSLALNPGAIAALIGLLEKTISETLRLSIAESLGKVALGNTVAVGTLAGI